MLPKVKDISNTQTAQTFETLAVDLSLLPTNTFIYTINKLRVILLAEYLQYDRRPNKNLKEK